MAHLPNQRRYDLDWLRVLAFALLILFHTGMMFNTWGWHVKNNQTSVLFEYIMRFTHEWRMPLLFLISGAAIWFAMDKYAGRKFIAERHKRLLIPLLFGMLFIIPPQVYHERLFQGQIFENFWQFYKTIFELTPYPEGNFSWHHLWYLPYIFTFSLIMFPVFRYLKSESGRAKLTACVDFFEKGQRILGWFVPIAISEIVLRPFWPDNANNLLADWAQFSTTLLIFCFGFMLASHIGIWQAIERNRFKALAGASIATFCLYSIWYSDLQVASVAELVFYRSLRMFHLWCWLLVFLGFAKRHLNRNHRHLKYANEAVYPFYILHQTITVVFGYYIVNWQASIAVKFLLVAAVTFFGCWLLLEGVIKHNNLLRLVFGMRPKRAAQSTNALKTEPVRVSLSVE